MSRYQKRRAMSDGGVNVLEALVAGVVGGLAFAAGSEAWAWLSPMRRRQEAIEGGQPGAAMGDGEFETVEVEEVLER